ncbi:unnamed protein product, partial [Rotaria magnacalcarata]
MIKNIFHHLLGLNLVFLLNDYQSDSSGSTKHLLRHICSKASLSTSVSAANIVEGPIDKFTQPKTASSSIKLSIQDSQKYRGPIDIDDVLVSATTISTNVAKLAHDYRSLIKPILIRQVECGLTIYFVDSDYKLYSFDLCCSRFNEVDKTGASALQIITTTPSKNKLKQVEYTDDTYSDDSSSEDDVPTPSPSKYIEANTIMSNLSTKAKEVLITIATSKKLVKYAKITELNKVIQERGGIALKQECIVRWLSMSNMLESIDTSIEHIRACLSFKTNYSFKLNNISQDALKDLIVLLSEFKNVSTLVLTGSRPTLHMAYISMNKLANHLNGTDVNNDGEIIQIFDRHD